MARIRFGILPAGGRGRMLAASSVRRLHFLVLVLLGCLQVGAACDQIPQGQTLRVRLLQPLSSYSSKVGTPVRGILIESPQCDGRPAFSVGTAVEGRVKLVRRVGLGFRHETAALEVEFDRILAKDGPALEMRARLLEVDNARETVRNGVIRGVRITETPQGFFTLRMIHLPSWNPEGLWILAARRAVFPVFPEPEIYFPSGTDLRLELAEPLDMTNELTPAFTRQKFETSEDEALDNLMRSFPIRTQTPKGRDTDVVNLAFIGSQQQLENAFQTAGWTMGDPVSKRAVLRQLLAVLSIRNYSRLPMHAQWMGGKANNLAWQKGLDSYSKRDHLRIWSEPMSWQGLPVWISSSTHDNAAVFSLRRGFIHRVNSDIDQERSKVVRDLTLAGCVDAVHLTSRPDMPGSVGNGTGDTLTTDKTISVVRLQNCAPPSFAEPLAAALLPARPRSRIARYARAQILSFRSDLWRSNVIYNAVQMSRAGIQAIRGRHHSGSD